MAAQRSIFTGGAIYDINLDGPGRFALAPAGPGIADVLLVGTTDQSAFSVDLTRTFSSFAGEELGIRRLIIRTGELSSIDAPDGARLVGPITPIRGDVEAVRVAAIDDGARLQIVGDLGTLEATRGVDLGPGGLIGVSGDVLGPIQIGGDLTLDGGLFSVGRDVDGPVAIGGDLRAERAGVLVAGRDLDGGLAIDGDLIAAALSGLVAGRDLATLDVDGDVDLTAGGVIRVGGDLDLLDVEGTVDGDGPGNEDIFVGLTLGNLTVAGGAINQPGIRGLDLDVGKNIQGLNVAHGIFESFVTAGVLIDAGDGTLPEGANIGPDGPVAIRNSEIRAGVQIRDFVIGGDVVTDRSIPGGLPTRIIAGLDRAGTRTAGANIDNFRIAGALIDGVIAASVFPGGTGFPTYDAPGGTILGGTAGDPIAFENSTAPPFDRTIDPTIDDVVLPGSINASFAPPPLPDDPDLPPETPIPLPSQSTVLGGVTSTRSPSQDQFDYAGIFAADTRGVFVGTLPR